MVTTFILIFLVEMVVTVEMAVMVEMEKTVKSKEIKLNGQVMPEMVETAETVGMVETVEI